MPSDTILKQRYKLISTLGKGSLGISYEAQDLRLGRKVCVKIIDKEISSDETFQKLFKKETSEAVKLIHNNINPIYDIDAESERIFIVSDYAGGGNLRGFVDKATLSTDEFLPILKNILKTLDYIHSKEVLHSAIKPENILFDENGEVKLCDISIINALYPYSENSEGRVDESSGYLAPEQIRGDELSEQTDIYSLGVVIFEVLCGQPPFKGDSAESTAFMQLKQKAKIPQELQGEISEKMQEVIFKCLAKKNENRYKSVKEILEAIEKIEPTPVLATKKREPELLISPSKTRENIKNVSLKLDESEKEETTQEIKEWAHLKTIAVIFFIFIACAIAFSLWFYGLNRIGEIKTPDLMGKKINQAQNIAYENGLSVSVDKEIYSSKPEGTILEQNPRNGEAIKQGRIIYVTLSRGNNSIEMPDLSNLTQKKATEKLSELGLANIKITEEYSDKYAKGYIISQLPVPQYMIINSSQITLTVSKGPSSPNRLPDLVGKTEEEAITILKSLKAKLIVTARESSTKVKAGYIIRQEPVTGTALADGLTVNIVVSKGFEGIIAPNLVGKSIEESLKIADSMGIALDYNKDYGTSAVITSQTPPAGESLISSSLSVTFSNYTIVPSLIGRSLNEIQDILNKSGLHIGEIYYREAPLINENTVLEQDPQEGIETYEGSVVNITLSVKKSPVKNENDEQPGHTPDKAQESGKGNTQ